MKTNHHPESQPRWEIVKLQPLSRDPVAWRGIASSGARVHISYHRGLLRIEVAEAARIPGGWVWRELLTVRPDYIELELETLRERQNPLRTGPGLSSTRRRERRAVADWFLAGECRSDRRSPAPRMTFWRLRALLQAREENFAALTQANVAGSQEHIIIATLVES